MFLIYSSIPLALSGAPYLPDNFHPHPRAVRFEPSRKCVGQFSVNDFVQFIFRHVFVLSHHLAAFAKAAVW
jgi:hypothetical protein